ncbi:MAG: lipid-binding SYLF domain-containing protein [Sulfurospirillaceae bacterium]|nr:lipid-binding SYLF domain-containing protein [Sulfurospirillaceae bacterium]
MKKILSILAISLWFSTSAFATAEEKLFDSANSLRNILRDTKGITPKIINSAHAIAIFPSSIRLGFYVGGKTGKGVMVARRGDGTWSNPFFVVMGGGSFGFQFGVEVNDTLLIFKNKEIIQKIAQGKITLGADASITAVTFDKSKNATAEATFGPQVLVYEHGKGLYAGVSLEGSMISCDEEFNAELYGSVMTPEKIISSQPLSSSYAIGEFLHALEVLEK